MIACPKTPVRKISRYDIADSQSLLSLQLRRKIFFNVLALHLIFVAVPFLSHMLANLFPKRDDTMEVKLVALGPDWKPDKLPGKPGGAPEVKAPEAKKDDPDKGADAPAPKEPKVKDPVPEKPAPKEPEMKQPQIKEPIAVKVKEPPPPEDDSTAKVFEDKAKPDKAVKADDGKSERKLLKPSEITISNTVVKGTAQTPSPSRNPGPSVSANSIADSIRKGVSAVKIGSGAGEGGEGGGIPSGVAGGGTATGPISYYQTVSAYLYKIWKQPMKAELQGRYPSAVVALSISGDGTVKSAKMYQSSGNQPMDRSVNELLSKLKVIPAPPDRRSMELNVRLEIVDE